MANSTAEQLVQSYEDWIITSPNYKSHLLKEALAWAILQNAGSGGGGGTDTAGDTPETITFYDTNLASLESILMAIETGADTTAAANYYTTALARLEAIRLATEAAPPQPELTTSTQTITALGLSNVVQGAGKASVGVQLLWTEATTDQVVRLEGSMNGTSWVSLSETLDGDTFTSSEITSSAVAEVQPGIRYRAFRPEYSSYRLRWVSGAATNLAITWGLV